MKQSLLLLHGAISSRNQFDVLLPFLKDKFEVHTLNFPGHGGDAIPEEFSIPRFATSVLDYISEKEFDKVVIFGYSMGGYVALYLVAHHPECIGKVFTMATKLEWTQAIAERETALLKPEKISEKVPAFAATLKQMHSPQDWKMVLKKTAAMLLDLGRTPALTEKEFSQINIPVTIGIGELDTMVSIDESEKAVSNIRNGTLLKLPSTPHPFEKVDHQLLATYIKEFFI